MVVKACCAKKCYNTSVSQPDKGFFGFPCDVTLCKEWLVNSGRTDLDIVIVSSGKGYYRLCSDHFEDKWFTDKTKRVLRRPIKPIPTIFVNNIGNYLPEKSQIISAVDVDSPSEDPLDIDDPSIPSSHEFTLEASEFLESSEHIPISYYTPELVKNKDYDPATVSKALLNLNPETELFQISDMCRFCMNKAASKYVEIFSKSDEACEIRKMCDNVMPKKIKICDGLPHKVCRPCIGALKTCNKLLEQFLNADRYLRAVAKYSLFIENENDSGCASCEDDVENLSEEEFIRPIPKNAMVIPIKRFHSSVEQSQNYIEDKSLKTTTVIPVTENTFPTKETVDIATGTEEICSTTQTLTVCSNIIEETNTNAITLGTDSSPVLILPGATVSQQWFEALPSLVSESNHTSSDDILWQGSMELMYNNNMNLQSENNLSQISTANGNLTKKITEKSPESTLFDLKYLGKEPLDTNNVEFISQVQNFNQGDFNISSVDFNSGEKSKSSFEIVYNLRDEHVDVFYKCLFCMDIFSSFPILEKHILHSHHKFPYTCNICDYKIDSSDLFLEHCKTKHGKTKLISKKCELSELGFNSGVELNTHITDKHSIKCSCCESFFHSQEKLDQHFSAKHDSRTQRNICGKQLANVQCKQVHKMSRSDCTQVCWICGKVLKNKIILYHHLKLHRDKTYTCNNCDKEFKTRSGLTQHKRLHKREYHEKNFLCEFCSKRFSCKQALLSHMRLHSSVKSVKCSFCGKGFYKKSLFIQHEKKRIESGVCPKLKRLTGLLMLKEIPSKECDVCGRKFYKTSSVQKHRKYHFCSGNPEIIKKLLDEPEVHKCDVCGLYYFSKSSLQLHMRLHTGTSKPFKCTVCGKSYAYNHQLNIHVLTHTGGKHLKTQEQDRLDKQSLCCKICGKEFRSQRVLLRHVFKHSGLSRYPCPYCANYFSTKQLLYQHIMKSHSKIEKQEQSVIDDFDISATSEIQPIVKEGPILTVHKMQSTNFNIPQGDSSFSCYKCSQDFVNLANLQEHIKKAHEEKEGEKEPEEGDLTQTADCVVEYLNESSISDLVIDNLSYIMSSNEYVI